MDAVVSELSERFGDRVKVGSSLEFVVKRVGGVGNVLSWVEILGFKVWEPLSGSLSANEGGGVGV